MVTIRTRTPLYTLLFFGVVASCDSVTRPILEVSAVAIEIDFGDARVLGAHEGVLELWIENVDDVWYPLGAIGREANETIHFLDPIYSPRRIAVALQGPDELTSGRPTRILLIGDVDHGSIELSLIGGVTQGSQMLREWPGQFTIFAPSTGPFHRYPHHEESGVWLFNTQPRQTEQNDAWVRLTPLTDGWIYEHWVVRDLDTPDEIWLSAGKFRPSRLGVVNERDDTGWGPFSGVADFRTAGEEQFPGADFYSNPLDLPFPDALHLPLDLTEQNEDGTSRWHYAITVDPSFDIAEPITTERPFPIIPYIEPFGTGGPGEPRTLMLREDGIPRGYAEVR